MTHRGAEVAMPETASIEQSRGRAVLGASAVLFSVLYVVSDLLEAAQGGFSSGQLWLTLVAEAAIPPVVVGLYLAQRPRIARSALIPAVAYAYAYVYFTGTVVYALVEGTPDYATLSEELGVWMTVHGVIMFIAGVWFGAAVARAAVLSRWTGIALALGVTLVVATQGAPEGLQLVAAAVRALGIAGMGVGVLLGARAPRATA
ncbi:hypothetical protein [Actinomycetospora flava]|uniref:Uncharacterized protein n=1 Tax=Actinomycetospora flava TaxID=3129232 RepID=A0ABU8MFG6_9PSEU